jgi:hypothetical protein
MARKLPPWLLDQRPFEGIAWLAKRRRAADQKKMSDPTETDIAEMLVAIGDDATFEKLAGDDKKLLFCAMLTIREQLKIYGELAMFEDEPVLEAEQAKPDIRKIRSQHMQHEAAMIADCLKLLGIPASWDDSPGIRLAVRIVRYTSGRRTEPHTFWRMVKRARRLRAIPNSPRR